MSVRQKIVSILRKRVGFNDLSTFQRFIIREFHSDFIFEENEDEEFFEDGETYFIAKDKTGNIIKYYPDSNEWTLEIKDEMEYTGFEFEDIKKYYQSATIGNLLFFPTS